MNWRHRDECKQNWPINCKRWRSPPEILFCDNTQSNVILRKYRPYVNAGPFAQDLWNPKFQYYFVQYLFRSSVIYYALVDVLSHTIWFRLWHYDVCEDHRNCSHVTYYVQFADILWRNSDLTVESVVFEAFVHICCHILKHQLAPICVFQDLYLFIKKKHRKWTKEKFWVSLMQNQAARTAWLPQWIWWDNISFGHW